MKLPDITWPNVTTLTNFIEPDLLLPNQTEPDLN
jgi:hypothetical protein